MIKKELKNNKNGEIVGRYATPQDAADAMDDYISDANDDLDPTDEDWLTPFDFSLADVEIKDEPNEIIVDYNAAREYLGGKPNKQFTVSQKAATMMNVLPTLDKVTRLVDALNPAHLEALIALNELFTIAQAWNAIDDFTPDFSNRNQTKWFPWLVYDPDRAGFVCADTYTAPSHTAAYVGSRLCFKTANRARQFGNQFIDLWNKVLLF